MASETEGFHRVQRVRITHGVPHGGWSGGREKVQVRLPAVAVNEKQPLNLRVDPKQYAASRLAPYVCHYVGRGTYWLYRDAVFIDFAKRTQPEVKALADQLLSVRPTAARPPTRRPGGESLFEQ